MKTHERVHEGGGYECDYCGRVFSQSGTLKDHMAKHKKARHVKTGDVNLRKEQIITDKRGRKSIADTLFGVGGKKSKPTAAAVKASTASSAAAAEKPLAEPASQDGKENIQLDIEQEMEAIFEEPVAAAKTS